MNLESQCPCGGTCWIDDPMACGDPDHCSPTYPCPFCNPDGYPECATHEESL